MKKIIVVLLSVVLLGGVGMARAAARVDKPAAVNAPASGQTFHVVLSETGNLDRDMAAYAEALRRMGFSEEEIQDNLRHYRAAWEGSRREVSSLETITFSVVVNSDDVQAYAQKLRAAGLSEAGVQALTTALQKARRGRSPQGLKDPCRIRTDGAEARNALGQVLYRYSSSIEWCYNGTHITWLNTWEAHSTYWGWQYVGSSSHSSGGVGEWRFVLDRYATMYNPVIHKYGYPQTHQIVYGNGYSWGTASP